jgi:hypothetical protein
MIKPMHKKPEFCWNARHADLKTLARPAAGYGTRFHQTAFSDVLTVEEARFTCIAAVTGARLGGPSGR